MEAKRTTPKGYMNNERASWAEEAVDTFTNETYGGCALLELLPEDRYWAIKDLICDIGHLCDAYDIDYETALDAGREMYVDEKTNPDD